MRHSFELFLRSSRDATAYPIPFSVAVLPSLIARCITGFLRLLSAVNSPYSFYRFLSIFYSSFLLFFFPSLLIFFHSFPSLSFRYLILLFPFKTLWSLTLYPNL